MGGGISIHVGGKYKSVLSDDISFVSDKIEFCSIKITICNESIYVIGNYRPHDKTKLTQFDEILSDVLTRVGARDCVFLVSDFNLDALSSNNHEMISVNNLLSHSFVLFINLPTMGTSSI